MGDLFLFIFSLNTLNKKYQREKREGEKGGQSFQKVITKRSFRPCLIFSPVSLFFVSRLSAPSSFLLPRSHFIPRSEREQTGR